MRARRLYAWNTQYRRLIWLRGIETWPFKHAEIVEWLEFRGWSSLANAEIGARIVP